MAVDLRATLAAIKIANELERIGDLAKNIGKRALVLNREPPIRLTQSLARMGRQSLAQLKMVLDAYSDRDAEAARNVWRHDEEIDELYNSLFPRAPDLHDGRSAHDRLVHASAVHRQEHRRAGDHATNIAETVFHMVTGSFMRIDRPKADLTSTTPIPHDPK
jgi:phosphate transport system protein